MYMLFFSPTYSSFNPFTQISSPWGLYTVNIWEHVSENRCWSRYILLNTWIVGAFLPVPVGCIKKNEQFEAHHAYVRYVQVGIRGETPILKTRFQELAERDDVLIFQWKIGGNVAFSTLSRETMMTSYSLRLCHSRHFQTHLISLPNRCWIGLHPSVFYSFSIG